MAIDWIANNLYWADSDYRQIMVAREDGRFQKVLYETNIDHPRGVTVDAINRWATVCLSQASEP